jgi:hypothetical protein
MLGVINFLMPREDEMEESDNQFTPKMNLVLEMLSSIKVEEFNNIIPQVRHVVRKLLSCAMAIAEVSVANDSANITESCQKVSFLNMEASKIMLLFLVVSTMTCTINLYLAK